MPPGLPRGIGIGLQECLPDCGGDHRVLAFGHMRQGIPHPMNPAPLPGGAEHARDRVAQALCASEITSLTPPRPRLTRPFRKADQNGSASDGPMPSPTISRRPSVLTATAI